MTSRLTNTETRRCESEVRATGVDLEAPPPPSNEGSTDEMTEHQTPPSRSPEEPAAVSGFQQEQVRLDETDRALTTPPPVVNGDDDKHPASTFGGDVALTKTAASSSIRASVYPVHGAGPDFKDQVQAAVPVAQVPQAADEEVGANNNSDPSTLSPEFDAPSQQETMIVVAEPVPRESAAPIPVDQQQRLKNDVFVVPRNAVYVVISVLLTAAAVTSGFCGTGKCSRSSEQQVLTVEVSTTIAPSPAPSTSSVRTRAQSIVAAANEWTLSLQPIVYPNGATPQDKAVQWLIEDDPLQLRLSTSTTDGNDSDMFRLSQRYALLTLWFQTTAEDDSWIESSGWLKEEDECEWYGVTCKTIFLQNGETPANAVSELRLAANNLRGSLPDDVAALLSLEYLRVHGNFLSGSIPSTLGRLVHLRELDLSFNAALMGTLPESLGNLTNLVDFNVRSCNLSGVLSIALAQWTNLQSFVVEENNFKGTLPPIYSQFAYLRKFDARSNDLTGTIPSAYGQLTSLLSFDVESNRLSGELPQELKQWTSLTVFDVSKNEFVGTIPDFNWNATIEEAFFYGNKFTGSVPDGFCTADSLERLLADCVIEVICSCCTGCCDGAASC